MLRRFRVLDNWCLWCACSRKVADGREAVDCARENSLPYCAFNVCSAPLREPKTRDLNCCLKRWACVGPSGQKVVLRNAISLIGSSSRGRSVVDRAVGGLGKSRWMVLECNLLAAMEEAM